MQDGSGSQTMMTGQNEVSHELIPPAKDGEPYKAIVIVTSQSRYSMQRSPNEKKTEETDQSTESGGDNGSGVEVFDSEVASAPGSTARPASTQPDKKGGAVARKDEKHESRYDLVYENGRWKLVTKLDPKTEGSIKLAFDRALQSQG
jgi:hypothetical protein